MVWTELKKVLGLNKNVWAEKLKKCLGKNIWAEKLKKCLGKNVWVEKNVFGLKRELFWAEKNVFGLKKRAHVN